MRSTALTSLRLRSSRAPTLIAEDLGSDFDLDLHLVQAAHAVENDLVVGQGSLDVQQGGLDLGGNTLMPRMIIMSSLRRPMRRMRRRVRPQGRRPEGGW